MERREVFLPEVEIMNSNYVPRCNVTMLCGMWVLLSHALFAHPFHTSSAEMEFNAKSGRYEVALKVLTVDLEKALAKHASANKRLAAEETKLFAHLRNRARVDLDKTPGIDKLITSYLKSNFFLSCAESHENRVANNTAEEKLSGLKSDKQVDATLSVGKEECVWVGKESERSYTWLYFELSRPVSCEDLSLTNRLLFELNSGQINVCVLRQDDARHALKSDSQQPTIALPSVK